MSTPLTFSAVLTDDITPVVDAMSEAFAQLGEIFDETMSMISEGFSAAEGETGSLDEALSALEEQFDATAATAQALADSADETSISLDEAASSAGDTADAASATVDAVSALQAALDTASESATTTAAALDALTTAASESAAAMQTAAAADEEKAAADDAATGSGMALKSTLLLVGAAAAAIGIGMLVMGSQAEDSLSLIRGLAGASASDMTMYTSSLETMANQVGTTLKEAADGLYYVVSAGFTGANALTVLDSAMKAAKAGGADMQTVADGLTSALNAYGVNADHASSYTDMMVTAVTQGKQSFQDFASAIGMAAVQGHGVNISFDQVSAAEATMTQSGLKARRAVMQLDFMMRAIALSTDSVAGKAKALGLSFDSTKYNTLDLIGKLQYLKSITGSNQLAFEKLVGGAAGLSAANILLTNGAAKYTGILDKMRTSTGATDAAFKVSQQNLSAGWGHMTAALSILAYEFTVFATPAVRGALEKFGVLFNKIADGIRQHADMVGPVLLVLAGIFGGILLAGIVMVVAAISTAIGAAAALIVPIIGISTAVGVVAAAVIALYAHSAALRQALAAIGGHIAAFAQQLSVRAAPAIANIVRLFQWIMSWLGPAWSAFWPILSQVLSGALDIVVGIIKVAWSIISTIFKVFLDVLGGNWSQAWQDIQDGARGVLDGLLQFLGGWWKGVTAIFSLLWGVVSGIWSHLWGWITAFVGGKLGDLGETISGAWMRFRAYFTVGMALIQAVLRAGFQQVITIVTLPIRSVEQVFSELYQHSYLFKAIVDFIISQFNTARSFIMGVWNAVTSWLLGEWNQALANARTVWNVITQVIGLAVLLVRARISEEWLTITGDLRQKWVAIQSIARAAWSALTALITGQVNQSKSNIASVFNGVVSFLQGLAPTFLAAGRALIQGLITGIKSMLPNVSGAASTIASAIKSVIGWHSPTEEGPGADSDTWAPNLMNMFAAGLQSGKSKAVNAALQVAAAVKAQLSDASGLGTAGSALSAGSSASSASAGLLPGGRLPGASSGGPVVNVPITFTGDGSWGLMALNPADRNRLLDQMSQGIMQRIKSQGKTGLNQSGS